MFFIRDAYAKIWEVEEKEKYVDVRMSTSEKDNREEGKYINSNWFGRCVGKAKEQISKIDTSHPVKIKTGKVSNELYTDKEGNKKNCLRVTIFEFDTDNYTPAQATSTNESKKAEPTSEPAADDYPF